MTGQTLLRPSRQAEAMIGGLTDATPSLGVTSNLFPLSGLSPSRVSTAMVHAASAEFGVETRKLTAKRNVSTYRKLQVTNAEDF